MVPEDERERASGLSRLVYWIIYMQKRGRSMEMEAEPSEQALLYITGLSQALSLIDETRINDFIMTSSTRLLCDGLMTCGT